MRLRIFWLSVLGIFIIPVLWAADVAMVAELSGKAKATLESSEWNLELAELLPENTKIEVLPDGKLKLIHLVENKEYELPEGAIVEILSDTIEGAVKTEATDLQIVSSQVDLGEDMGLQVGAYNPDRILKRKPVIVKEEKSADSFDQPRLYEDKIENSVLGSRIDGGGAVKDKALKIDLSFPVPPSSSVPSFQEKPSDDVPKIARLASKKKVLPEVHLFLALPSKMFQERFGSAEKFIKLMGLEDASIRDKEIEGFKWHYIKISGNFAEKVIKEKDAKERTPVCILSQAINPEKMVELWKLEQKGFFGQAAAGWMTLNALEIINERTLRRHLRRIEKRMTQN